MENRSDRLVPRGRPSGQVGRQIVNILVVQSELGVLRGGGENFTRNLFSAFARRGHQVTATFVADAQGKYPIQLPVEIKSCPLAGYWSRKFGQDVLSSVAAWLPEGLGCRTTWNRIQEALCWRTVRWHDRRFAHRVETEFDGRWNQYDAVFVHGNALLAGRIAQVCPTILRLPGPVSPDLAPVLNTIQSVCANGDALLHLRGFLGDHATELPIGLDGELFKPGSSPQRERLGWTEADWVIGYVGRLAYVKGVDLLADAFKKLQAHVPHARLLMIGAGEEEGKLRELLKDELATGVVHMELDVPHERLGDWYRAMDVFVMPSRYENFSNAVLEALACGVPFLGSNVGGNPRLVESHGGHLFASASSEALCGALRFMVENVRRGERHEVARLRPSDKATSWDVAAARLEEIIMEDLVRKETARRGSYPQAVATVMSQA